MADMMFTFYHIRTEGLFVSIAIPPNKTNNAIIVSVGSHSKLDKYEYNYSKHCWFIDNHRECFLSVEASQGFFICQIIL